MNRKLLLAASALTAMVLMPPVAMAQSAEPAAASPMDDTQTVIVTGIRKSIKQALDIKRNAVNSVDAIASEDMGKMPDQNVAESLQRVPGITISRNNGVGNGVTVRGLGPQFNTVTLNGRVIATDSAGREFNFDSIAPELISGVNVYKSPQADLNGASIGATIDIKTLRPLDQKRGMQYGGSLRANISDLNSSTTPSGAAFLSWKNDAGNMGLSIVGTYDKKEERTDIFTIGASTSPRSYNDGYYGSVSNVNGSVCVGKVTAGVCSPRIDTSKVPLFTGVSMIHNLSTEVDISKRERTGVNATFQYKPNDDLILTFDGFASKNKRQLHTSGLAYDFSGGTLVEQIVEGGTAGTATIAGVSNVPTITGGKAVYEKFVNGTVDEIVQDINSDALTTLFGFNARWTHDDLTLVFDANTSKVDTKGQDAAFTTIRRTGMTLDYDRRSGSEIYDFSMSNPNYTNAATDLNHIGGHYMSVGGANRIDTTHEIKLDGKWDGGAIVAYAGIGFEDRSKDTDATSFNAPPVNGSSYCITGCDGHIILPSSIFHATNYNLLAGEGGDIVRDWIDYDTKDLIAALKQVTAYKDPIHDPAASSRIEEKVTLGYLMADFKGEIGNMPLAINGGFRIEDTNFTSSGAGQNVVSALPNGNGQNIIVLSSNTPVTFKGHYRDILPSFNARLNVSDDLIVRASASRVISRPTLTDLSPAQSISSNPGNERITRGNPDLQPFRAAQAEMGVEWYFGKLSLLSATTFYKSIDSFIVRGTTQQKVDQVVFQVDQPVNGKGATVSGYELSYRQVFADLPAPFDGLGAAASYTSTESDADYSNVILNTHYTLQGLSKSSYTLQGFYEKGPLQARISYTWRDTYLISPATQTGYPLFSDPYDQVDAGIQYSLTDHIVLSFDALNLTDSKEFDYANTRDNTQDYRSVGKRYTVGIRFKY